MGNCAVRYRSFSCVHVSSTPCSIPSPCGIVSSCDFSTCLQCPDLWSRPFTPYNSSLHTVFQPGSPFRTFSL
ncbi:hypothetical protein BDV96DRAFT_592103 [Lophiotrema nucula]|uniref:Uncharacterized protein n=1 Tax=Lophiotrema nucula TaxID=690887 RepID=A0A6A5YEL8_9PLEO|nr:hypothetical protein BDV96DRAFT_592103 [Lophiotrema nucula]